MVAWDAVRVGLITLWYRSGEQMTRYLADLHALEYAHVQPVFVIHEQTREEVARLRASVPRASILEPGANLGTAAGWNLAIRYLLGQPVEYIGIWNVDVKLHRRALVHLVCLMQSDPRIGACQPLLFYSDEPARVEMFGGSVDLRGGRLEHDFKGETRLHALPPVRDAQYLDGGTMLLRADALRKVGAFDENFFLYDEDADLSVRLRRVGYRTVAVRDAWAWHYHREYSGRLPRPYQVFYETRNRFYLTRKHGGHVAWVRLLGRTILGLPRVVVRYLRRGRVRLAYAYVAGVAHGVAGHTGKQGWVT